MEQVLYENKKNWNKSVKPSIDDIKTVFKEDYEKYKKNNIKLFDKTNRKDIHTTVYYESNIIGIIIKKLK